MLGLRAIEPGEFITKTMIKKAYREAKVKQEPENQRQQEKEKT